MSLPSNLEQNGKLEDFPAVELLNEAVSASLGGTFRFESAAQKIAVYLSEGEFIFAASTARQHRLVLMLTQWNALAESELVGMVNMPEPELAVKLVETGKLTLEAMKSYRIRQVTEILMTALGWTTGEWNFNPLVRVREDMRINVELSRILMESARQLPPDFVQKRFENDLSMFGLSPNAAPEFNLSPEEAYILSRFEGTMNAETAAMIGGLPFEKTCRVLYSMWLGGVLYRTDYKNAFDEAIIQSIRSAKISLSPKSLPVETKTANGKQAEVPSIADSSLKTADAKLPEISPEEEISEEVQVETFLQRVETAKSFYQILGINNSLDAKAVKDAYFKLAKQFHPDKFHSIGGTTHLRLQSAFTQLAQAYETLKDAKHRELYDFKLSKQAAISGDKSDVSQFTPEEIYQSGVKELQGGNYNQAVAYLNRAVQLSPNVAEYQARLGQALAINPKFRHQAEEKMQLAIRLDEKNADWRLLLAGYFIAVGLNKRAIGELDRLLAIYPNHEQAQQMLADLR
ncbi:MAG: DnaJ domain-containing protein [Pyrinomonadaceae bacterium]